MTISQVISIYWPVFISTIGGIFTVIGVWMKLTTRVAEVKDRMAELEKDMAKLEGRVDTMQPDLGTIKTDIAVMKNTLEFIKGAIAQPSGITNNIKSI